MSRALTVRQHAWPIRGSFTISRGSKTSADTLIVEITDGDAVGRGECVPYARYGETLESAEAQVRSITAAVDDGADRSDLLGLLPACAARNAVDCALWDLAAKLSGRPAWQLAGLAAPKPVETAYTISLDTVDAMGAAAAKASAMPLLKLKLTGEGDVERVAAVRENAPDARIIVDANEAWTEAHLGSFVPALASLGVEMIEQPLPAGKDDALAGYDGPITLCADESCHDRSSLDDLAGKYGMVNIKLDKTGGLTEALALREQARERSFQVMIGCMLASSLAMAPALLLAQDAEVVDLDGSLWLAEDYQPPLRTEGALLHPPEAALWG
ncbi:MAG: N-acetyl-D-Glu racemase DgcA [Pseudomonadota bacterium]